MVIFTEKATIGIECIANRLLAGKKQFIDTVYERINVDSDQRY